MLKRGQIKFSKKAAEVTKRLFLKKKVNEFLAAVEKGKQKPSGYKDFYKLLLGEKQDISSLYKTYTKDVMKARKLFEVTLVKEGRLSMMLCLEKNCLLYITKDQQGKYERLKLPKTAWPVALVNEKDNTSMIKFISQMRTQSVDLSNLILEISK